MLGCAVSPSKEDGSADLVACPLFRTRGVTERRAAGAGRAPGGRGAGERRLRQAARLRPSRAQTVMVQYKVNSVRKAQGVEVQGTRRRPHCGAALRGRGTAGWLRSPAGTAGRGTVSCGPAVGRLRCGWTDCVGTRPGMALRLGDLSTSASLMFPPKERAEQRALWMGPPRGVGACPRGAGWRRRPCRQRGVYFTGRNTQPSQPAFLPENREGLNYEDLEHASLLGVAKDICLSTL